MEQPPIPKEELIEPSHVDKAPAEPKEEKHSSSEGSPKEDETLYNAIIISLIIGIIIVVATLIISRPAPEYFSEIYFESHKELPKFMAKDDAFNYTFTIANHGNSTRTYLLNTSTTLYRFNYACESPAMYFDENILATEGIENVTRRTAETKDPVAYIKEANYSYSFEWRAKVNRTGRYDLLTISFKGLDGREKYSITFNDTAIYASPGIKQSVSKPINYTNVSKRYIAITTRKDKTIISVDSKKVLEVNTSKDYTGGFLSFETQGINTEIPWISLTKGSNKGISLLAGKKQNCNLILLNATAAQEPITIEKDKNITLSRVFYPGSIKTNGTADMAKLQLQLDSGEEIHFWSALT
jgi:hypothetical protein